MRYLTGIALLLSLVLVSGCGNSAPNYVEMFLSGVYDTKPVKEITDVAWSIDVSSEKRGRYVQYPFVTDQGVYWGNFGEFQKIDLQTGKVQWKYEVMGVPSVPVISKDLICLSDNLGIHCLKEASGQLKWEQLFGTPRNNLEPEIVTATADTLVYKGREVMKAYDIHTGTEHWKQDTDKRYRNSNARIIGYKVYLRSIEKMAIYDLKTGKLEEEKDIGGLLTDIIPYGKDLIISVTDLADTRLNQVYFYDRNADEKKWTHEIDATQDRYYAPFITLMGDKVLVTETGKGDVSALSMSKGEKQWSSHIGEAFISKAIVVDDYIYVSSGTDIVCLESITGSEKWRYSIGKRIATAPIVMNEMIYVIAGDNELFALR